MAPTRAQVQELLLIPPQEEVVWAPAQETQAVALAQVAEEAVQVVALVEVAPAVAVQDLVEVDQEEVVADLVVQVVALVEVAPAVAVPVDLAAVEVVVDLVLVEVVPAVAVAEVPLLSLNEASSQRHGEDLLRS
jgi:hypothetical protein